MREKRAISFKSHDGPMLRIAGREDALFSRTRNYQFLRNHVGEKNLGG